LYVWEIISLREKEGASGCISGVQVHRGGNNILRKYAYNNDKPHASDQVGGNLEAHQR